MNERDEKMNFSTGLTYRDSFEGLEAGRGTGAGDLQAWHCRLGLESKLIAWGGGEAFKQRDDITSLLLTGDQHGQR